MSFLTERYFQRLEDHPMYELIRSRSTLGYFMERHVICAWSYQRILMSIQRDLLTNIQPIKTESLKEAIRIITEIVMEEEVLDLGGGRLVSMLELYIEAMQDVGCDISRIVAFFDAADSLQNSALKNSQLQDPMVEQYAQGILQLIESPLHVRATLLFYEGEPYIPDSFLYRLEKFEHTLNSSKLLDYFERHIEGLKCPGFSPAGRLIEILSNDNNILSSFSDTYVERLLLLRLNLWNSVSASLNQLPRPKPTERKHLTLLAP